MCPYLYIQACANLYHYIVNIRFSQVAGVPVAHWSGNKSGLGYNRDNPDIVVGGRSSVDLPSDSRSGRRGMLRGKAVNRGRGLLPTPLFSPWPIDYDGRHPQSIYFIFTASVA